MLDDTNDEYDVYINLISSSAGRYLSRRPHIISLVRELSAASTLKGRRIVIERDMGRAIGTTDVVATGDTDTIYYAQPVKSEVFSRFAKNRFAQPSSVLTVIFIQDDDGNYEVSDTWIGADHPAFPGDQFAGAESMQYWQTHALVQDAQVVQSKSVTKNCPY